MTINGIDITTYGARQHKVEFGYSDISNSSEWINSAVLPHFEGTIGTWKHLGAILFVYGSGRDEIHEKVSKLYAQLMDPADIVFDGISHKFRAVMTAHAEEEFTPNRCHKVTVTLQGYEYGEEISSEGTGSVRVMNPGSTESPLLLTITPSVSAANVVLTGVCRNKRTGADMPVTLQTVTRNVPIVLDGANGLFTEGSSLKSDIVIKAVPAVKPGITDIVSSNTSMALAATVLPLYL